MIHDHKDFKETTCERQAPALQVVKAVAKGESGWPFAVPVTDDVAPGYSNEVKRPMDLGSVAMSLKLGAYVTLGMHASLGCHGLCGDIASQQTLCNRNMLSPSSQQSPCF